MASATERELWLVSRAIALLEPEGTASLIAEKTTQAQWNAIIDWLETKRKEVLRSRIERQIADKQEELAGLG